ncbi:GNAT family N-acetyltransferase [Qipengyuania spongiae]|uniref:N-acetyltransferase n=1 Tax=Qipengyuania spongiae TaxID=2909673 RepID=A0ABY5SZY3_9SPHN|nr:GNAT family N-acetyltransferase [Qipengyuania spongiae]UVI40078.1 N-acetyltransferase [Qipengyuania spongiae]
MSSQDITIEHRDNSGGGEYRARTAEGEHAGELTWHPGGDNVRVADHTGVPPSMRGRGIAEKLVLALIEDAREQGFTVRPACSYVAAQFKRHPEWSELHAG